MSEALRQLEALLPHRPPMILLDEVVACVDDYAEARVTIRRDAPFFDAALDAMPAWVGIEYMAQTIALWGGDQQLRSGREIKVAFLLGTRAYRSNVAQFPPGALLSVRVDALYGEESGLGAFGCRIDGPGIEVTARISAFRPQNPEDYVKQIG